MSFLCLKDLIVNMEDIVLITPRWEIYPSLREQQNKKIARGTTFYLRGKEGVSHSEVLYEEVMEQVKQATAGKQ